MRNIRYTLAVGIVMLAACQKEESTGTQTETGTYAVSFEEVTKRVAGSDAPSVTVTPGWNAGAQLYFADDASTKSGTQVKVTDDLLSEDGGTLAATFRTISDGARKVYAICAEDAWIRRWRPSFTLSYDGTFSGSAAAVGETDVEEETLRLSPLNGLVEFAIGLPYVKKVLVKASSDIFPSKMEYDFKENEVEFLSRLSAISVQTDGTGTYYFPVVPQMQIAGFDIDLYNEAGMVISSVSIDGGFSVSAGEVVSIGMIDIDIDDIIDPDLPQAESAADAVRNMGVGLNLCATFEEFPWEGYGKADRNDPFTFENMYSAKTNAKTMTATAEAGFRCMRIPVTWILHMDDPTSEIDEVWLDRIEEVVNYVLDAGLYCILNVHHDTGMHDSKGTWLFADWNNYQTMSAGFKNIWRQIAARFKDYDYRLLFESYNELLDERKTWFTPSSDNGYKAANALNQDFVNTVRVSGGRNATRNLIVTTYSAGTTEKTLKSFVMPSDILPGHLAVQIHSYLPAKFVTAKEDHREEFYDSDIAEIDAMFALLKKYILDKGYPCVMGEYGAYPRKKADGSQNPAHDEQRGRHAAVYTRKCLEAGIAPVYWYNPMETYHREWGKWTYTAVKDSLIKAYNEHITTLQ